MQRTVSVLLPLMLLLAVLLLVALVTGVIGLPASDRPPPGRTGVPDQPVSTDPVPVSDEPDGGSPALPPESDTSPPDGTDSRTPDTPVSDPIGQPELPLVPDLDDDAGERPDADGEPEPPDDGAAVAGAAVDQRSVLRSGSFNGAGSSLPPADSLPFRLEVVRHYGAGGALLPAMPRLIVTAPEMPALVVAGSDTVCLIDGVNLRTTVPVSDELGTVLAAWFGDDGNIGVIGHDGRLEVFDATGAQQLGAGVVVALPDTGGMRRLKEAIPVPGSGGALLLADHAGNVWLLPADADVTDADARVMLVQHESLVSALAVSPDGSLALSAGSDGTVMVHDLASGTTPASLALDRGPRDLVFASATQAIALPGPTLVPIDVLPGPTLEAGTPVPAPEGFFIALAVSPDGTELVTTSSGGATTIRDTDGNAIREIPVSGQPTAYRIAWPDAGTILTAGPGNELVRIDPWTGERQDPPLARHQGMVSGAAAAGDTLVSGSDGEIRTWRLSDGALLQTITDETVVDFALSPDGTKLALLHKDGRVALTEPTLTTPPVEMPGGALDVEGIHGVHHIVVTDNGAVVAARGREVRTWRSPDTEPQVLDYEGQWIRDIAIDPAGMAWIVAEHLDRLDLAAGSQTTLLTRDDAAHNINRAIAPSPDGRGVLIAGVRGLWLCDATTGARIADQNMNAHLLSPMGRSSRVAALASSLHVFGTADGTITELARASTPVRPGALTGLPASNDQLITGNRDGTLTLWRIVPAG